MNKYTNLKSGILVIGLTLGICLTGCTANTPVGKVEADFNSIKYTDNSGNEHGINYGTYMDALFANTAFPNGKTREDFEAFISDNFKACGFDLDNLDLGNADDFEKAKEVVKKTLEDNGVDTSNITDEQYKQFIEEWRQSHSLEDTTSSNTDSESTTDSE